MTDNSIGFWLVIIPTPLVCGLFTSVYLENAYPFFIGLFSSFTINAYLLWKPKPRYKKQVGDSVNG